MKKRKMGFILVVFLIVTGIGSAVFSAYHHEGEQDAANFLAVYPEKAGTKLDHCALCHSGGSYEQKGKTVTVGSCQWCHYSYGYDGSGNILDTMNAYGTHYHDHGRNATAVKAIEPLDSDGDGYSNLQEIQANRFPGNAADDPSKVTAPFRIYTREQIMALGQHTQFLLMNTSRQEDFYAEYTGVPVEDLLRDAGMLPGATGILAYAPDGWSQYHPLTSDPDPELYHIWGTYPASVYYYDVEADVALNPTDGWCDYSAPSCAGRTALDPIVNPNGLKVILAYKREGVPMDPGALTPDNKLDGEGPFRVVPPQKAPSPPDQSSRAAKQEVVWPYNYDWDHNAGAATRTVTIIKVEPLPTGTTDIDVLEAGWAYVDQEKVVVYGALDGTDSNGNGVLDSEEGSDPSKDFNGDGLPDYQDVKTARVRQANGGGLIMINTSAGALANVQALNADDPAVPQSGKPQMNFPFGTVKFGITGLKAGESVTVTLVFPGNVSATSSLYKISTAPGWHTVPIGSRVGNDTISFTLTDGDPQTDADGVANGVIQDPVALATPATTSSGGGGGGCFIAALTNGLGWEKGEGRLDSISALTLMIFSLFLVSGIAIILLKEKSRK